MAVKKINFQRERKREQEEKRKKAFLTALRCECLSTRTQSGKHLPTKILKLFLDMHGEKEKKRVNLLCIRKLMT